MSPRRSPSRNKKANPGRVVFCALQVVQIFAAGSVAGVISIFVAKLRSQEFAAPWAFYTLLGTSSFAIIISVILTLLALMGKISIKLRLIIQACLGLLWMIIFTLITIRTHLMLTKSCATWATKPGVGVCTKYKTLFIGGLAGLTTATVSICHDLFQNHRKAPRIKYSKAKGLVHGEAIETNLGHHDQHHQAHLKSSNNNNNNQPYDKYIVTASTHDVSSLSTVQTAYTPQDLTAKQQGHAKVKGQVVIHSNLCSRESLLSTGEDPYDA